MMQTISFSLKLEIRGLVVNIIPQGQHQQLPLRSTPSLFPHQADHELIPEDERGNRITKHTMNSTIVASKITSKS
jgi:hypothetical protein